MTIPLPVIANTYRATFLWRMSGYVTTAVNVMHFRALATTSTSAGLFGALQSSAQAAQWYLQPTSAQIYQINIIPLDGTSPTTAYSPAGSNWQGQSAIGDILPQVSGLVKLQTALRGRSNRGRVYLPLVTEGNVTNGSIVSGAMATWQGGWTGFLNAIGSATPNAFAWGVASYDRHHDGAGAHFTPISSVVCESLTATQRRRQPGRKVARH